jgi:hypothetical protein
LSIVGDVSLSGTLEISLVGPAPVAGSAYNVLSAVGDLTGIFTDQVLPDLGTDLDWLIDYNLATDSVTLQVLSLLGVMGGDFNGDGVVDAADLAIWEMNVGIMSGASPLQGDADGDGDVDGDDFLIWLMESSMPGAGGGAATGTVANVPEPASFTLALFGGLLALALRRR